MLILYWSEIIGLKWIETISYYFYVGLDLVDGDAKNMLMCTAECSFQYTKKGKTLWDSSRLPQSIIIVFIKISFGYIEKGILFQEVF